MDEAHFATGCEVMQTGVYAADSHRHKVELVLLRGQAFPGCTVCGAKVEFQLVKAAPYAFDVDDFSPGK